MGLMAVPKEVRVEYWVVQKGLKNDIQIAGLPQVEQAPDALFGARTLAGIAPNIKFVRRAIAEATFLGNFVVLVQQQTRESNRC